MIHDSLHTIHVNGNLYNTKEQDFAILSWISQDLNIDESWGTYQLKGDIHRFVSNSEPVLCECWGPNY